MSTPLRKRLRPAVAASTHLLAAGILWSLVGLVLCGRGVLMLNAARGLWWGVVAVAAGTAKALWVLDRTARRNIQRIRRFDDKTCLGAVYTWKTWGLVAVMIGGGWLLRHSGLPQALVGAIYVGVGWALFVSSRLAWQAWLT